MPRGVNRELNSMAQWIDVRVPGGGPVVRYMMKRDGEAKFSQLWRVFKRHRAKRGEELRFSALRKVLYKLEDARLVKPYRPINPDTSRDPTYHLDARSTDEIREKISSRFEPAPGLG